MICIKLYFDSCRQVWNVKNTVFWGGLSDKSDRSDGSDKSEKPLFYPVINQMVRKAKTEMQLSNCFVASRQLLSCNSPIALLQLHFCSAKGGLIGRVGRLCQVEQDALSDRSGLLLCITRCRYIIFDIISLIIQKCLLFSLELRAKLIGK